LEKVGVQARTYFSPACHQQASFRHCPRTRVDVTERLSRRIVSLPLWEEMGRFEVEKVVKGLA
jgi:dTDP-4-amino-4,6-dideoxygalactose transaminase